MALDDSPVNRTRGRPPPRPSAGELAAFRRPDCRWRLTEYGLLHRGDACVELYFEQLEAAEPRRIRIERHVAALAHFPLGAVFGEEYAEGVLPGEEEGLTTLTVGPTDKRHSVFRHLDGEAGLTDRFTWAWPEGVGRLGYLLVWHERTPHLVNWMTVALAHFAGCGRLLRHLLGVSAANPLAELLDSQLTRFHGRKATLRARRRMNETAQMTLAELQASEAGRQFVAKVTWSWTRSEDRAERSSLSLSLPYEEADGPVRWRVRYVERPSWVIESRDGRRFEGVRLVTWIDDMSWASPLDEVEVLVDERARELDGAAEEQAPPPRGRPPGPLDEDGLKHLNEPPTRRRAERAVPVPRTTARSGNDRIRRLSTPHKVPAPAIRIVPVPAPGDATPPRGVSFDDFGNGEPDVAPAISVDPPSPTSTPPPPAPAPEEVVTDARRRFKPVRAEQLGWPLKPLYDAVRALEAAGKPICVLTVGAIPEDAATVVEFDREWGALATIDPFDDGQVRVRRGLCVRYQDATGAFAYALDVERGSDQGFPAIALLAVPGGVQLRGHELVAVFKGFAAGQGWPAEVCGVRLVTDTLRHVGGATGGKLLQSLERNLPAKLEALARKALGA